MTLSQKVLVRKNPSTLLWTQKRMQATLYVFNITSNLKAILQPDDCKMDEMLQRSKCEGNLISQQNNLLLRLLNISYYITPKINKYKL